MSGTYIIFPICSRPRDRLMEVLKHHTMIIISEFLCAFKQVSVTLIKYQGQFGCKPEMESVSCWVLIYESASPFV